MSMADTRAIARWEQIRDLFEAVADLPVQQQQNYLVEHCADDHELRHEVEVLVEADRQAPHFLDDQQLNSLMAEVRKAVLKEYLPGWTK